jgi:hypothetical protein
MGLKDWISILNFNHKLMTGLTKEDRIKTVFGGGGHVVILGAGASIASTRRNPELTGKQLPSMNDFIQVVGLEDIVHSLPTNLRATNFEELYSKLHHHDPFSKTIKEIEKRVYNYFKEMKLPETPTIYDYLVLSLRSRDIIAKFNWDPFLYQAWSRNKHVGDFPYIAFLHGSVSLGYNEVDKRSGTAGMYSKKTLGYFQPTRLLFPVSEKDYNSDEFTKSQWVMLDSFLSDRKVKRLTIFGYGAPSTDVEAIKALNKDWGTGTVRNMEQFEIIDIRAEKELVKTWKEFINTHHYDYTTDYFKSSLAYNPRRTFESYFQHIYPETPEEAFSESNPIPSDFKTLKDLQDWHQNLVDAEKEYYSRLSKNEYKQ